MAGTENKRAKSLLDVGEKIIKLKEAELLKLRETRLLKLRKFDKLGL